MLTPSELETFHDFALAEINNGGVGSLDDCLLIWREYQETIAAIHEAEADIAAGRTKPLDEAIADIRRDLGLPERRPIS